MFNNSTPFTMPVAPAYATNGGGFGGFGYEWIGLIIIIALLGWGGNGFGGGFGRLREVCGAFSGACAVAGLLWGYSDTSDKNLKAQHYALIQDMAERFRKINGSLICRELLEGIESSANPQPSDRNAEYYKKRPCPKIAASAAAILDEIIAERQNNTQTEN